MYLVYHTRLDVFFFTRILKLNRKNKFKKFFNKKNQSDQKQINYKGHSYNLKDRYVQKTIWKCNKRGCNS